MQSNNSGIGYNKIRKKYLEKMYLITYGFCKYHKGENTNYHKPKPDKYKNIKREAIRKIKMKKEKSKKLYKFSFEEFNREQEYGYDKLIYAYNSDEALKIGINYLKTWYGNEEFKEEIENIFLFYDETIKVKYSPILIKINKEEYLENLFQENLIN
jgi:hypothetical protein